MRLPTYRFTAFIEPCLPVIDQDLRRLIIARAEKHVFGIGVHLIGLQSFCNAGILRANTMHPWLVDAAQTCMLPPEGSVLITQYTTLPDVIAAMAIIEQRKHELWPRASQKRIEMIKQLSAPYADTSEVFARARAYPILLAIMDSGRTMTEKVVFMSSWLKRGIVPDAYQCAARSLESLAA